MTTTETRAWYKGAASASALAEPQQLPVANDDRRYESPGRASAFPPSSHLAQSPDQFSALADAFELAHGLWRLGCGLGVMSASMWLTVATALPFATRRT